jgi:hypothetical protein
MKAGPATRSRTGDVAAIGSAHPTVPPEHEAARLRAALRALLVEAKSGQHRRDRNNAKCPPMEVAIERAEELLR